MHNFGQRPRRAALGGYLPQRRRKASQSFETPKLEAFDRLLKSTGDREISTTMAFVQGLNIALRDKQVGPRLVPIVADEARTFGMEGMFRQIGIYAPFGQKYKPVDADQLMYYREDQSGQVLQQGISEPGAMSSWMAAGTSYSVSNVPMLPFYIYYSMFGFQRIGDIAWQAADMRTRGFLLGGTAGRTTLNGEGLQHEDGFSHVVAGGIPNVRSYDPTFGFEVAVVLQHGMQKMLQEQVDEYYYVTLMNENYSHPDMPDGVEDGIIRGLYRFRSSWVSVLGLAIVALLLLLAAIGPKNVALTAEIAEGWQPIFYMPEKAKDVWGDALAAGYAKRDATLPPMDIYAGPALAIGDNVEGMREFIKPHIALYIGGMGAKGKNFYHNVATKYGYGAEADRIQELYLAGDKDGAAKVVPDELVRDISLIGSREFVKERVAAFREAGVTVLNVVPMGATTADRVKLIEELRELV